MQQKLSSPFSRGLGLFLSLESSESHGGKPYAMGVMLMQTDLRESLLPIILVGTAKRRQS
jgi:hypothetical protein